MPKSRDELLAIKPGDGENFGDVDYYVQETRKTQVPLEIMETEDEETGLRYTISTALGFRKNCTIK